MLSKHPVSPRGGSVWEATLGHVHPLALYLAFLLASARSIFTATSTGQLELVSKPSRAKSLPVNFSIPSTSQR